MTLCITTVVDKRYHEYIPLFVYCATRSWPEATVTVFTTSEPSSKCLELYDRIVTGRKEEGSLRWGGMEGYDKNIHRLPAFLRYLLFTSKRIKAGWWDYDHVYITDGDMLMTPQKPGLVQQHTRHMKRTGMCYSNVLRGYRPFVMTGLHFVTAEYIRRVAPTVDKYDRLFRKIGLKVLDAKAKIKDERLLYQIVRDAGLQTAPIYDATVKRDYHPEDPASCDRKLFRPWHGVNVGRAKGSNWKAQPFKRSRHPYFHQAVMELYQMARDPLFQRCYSFLSDASRQAIRRMVRATCAEVIGAFL